MLFYPKLFSKILSFNEVNMPYTIYAEGLYRAIQEVSALGLPIYITENGAADNREDGLRRDMWIKRYLYATHKAIQDGFDVRGFFYWSLIDNYEWNLGYVQKFGLYKVDMETKERTLRNGTDFFIKMAMAQA